MVLQAHPRNKAAFKGQSDDPDFEEAYLFMFNKDHSQCYKKTQKKKKNLWNMVKEKISQINTQVLRDQSKLLVVLALSGPRDWKGARLNMHEALDSVPGLTAQWQRHLAG